METFVALLRGINVGGKRRLPMAELTQTLSSLGLEDVVTYIQSGNVVFGAPAGDPAALAARVEQAIAEAFALDVAVLLRTPTELAEVASCNPFLNDRADVSKLHVVFLERKPTAANVARLDSERSAPDELSLCGTEIYLRLPSGSGRSKLTIDYFERTLATRATARNWNTLIKLLALAQR